MVFVHSQRILHHGQLREILHCFCHNCQMLWKNMKQFNDILYWQLHQLLQKVVQIFVKFPVCVCVLHKSLYNSAEETDAGVPNESQANVVLIVLALRAT